MMALFATLMSAALLALAQPVLAQSTPPAPAPAEAPAPAQSSVAATTASAAPEWTPAQELLERLKARDVSAVQAADLWQLIATDKNASLITEPVVSGLLAVTTTPRARDALWTQLSQLAARFAKTKSTTARDASLLGHFERHRATLMPAVTPLRDTESGGDEMVRLMLASKVFGENFDDSLARVVALNPAAVARRIEHDRGQSKPVKWEDAAFKHMQQWKDARFAKDAPDMPDAPKTLAALDAVGETYVAIFNNLHALPDTYRQRFLRGLSSVDVFNAVVGGELELYRMGTSSYRDHLHAVIMQGLKDSGSFEAFIERAAPTAFGPDASDAVGRRGMVFLRVVTSFGLLDEILATVGDRDQFIAAAIASLGDSGSFETNSSVVMDILTVKSASAKVTDFKRALLDQLYVRYDSETAPRLRNVYGSMLSVYQTISGDRRDRAIDLAYALDESIYRIPFERLYTANGRGRYVHRMFMRLDKDADAIMTYASFSAMMRSRGASVRNRSNYAIFKLQSRGRTVEIYANKPTARGISRGIDEIGEVLKDKRVETVIGRGHTSIVTPLQESAKRILADRISAVAAVIVGTCGGDASIRDLIETFGYRSYFTTRSTGRGIINNELINAYINSLLELRPGKRLALETVLERGTHRFMRKGADVELHEDASFYRLSMASVLTARLFETHVSPHIPLQRQAAK